MKVNAAPSFLINLRIHSMIVESTRMDTGEIKTLFDVDTLPAARKLALQPG